MQPQAGGPVRLEDVAREAGVSTATVSHALRGKGRVSEATRERIRTLAETMGYRPNAAARRLAGGRVGLIAVAFSLPGRPPVGLTEIDYFGRAIRAATARALDRDYALFVAPPAPRTSLWSRVPLDGVVLFDPVPGDPVLAELRAREIPLVLSGRDPDGGDEVSVDNDHLAGTRTVLDHLAESGARRVALLVGDMGDTFTSDCVTAYRAWAARQGSEPLVVTLPFGRFAETAEVDRLLASSDPPDAIYATVEALGLTALDAAAHQAIRVPGDLLVAVAADRNPPSAKVPLTTLELDPARTAAEAVDALVDLIEERPQGERSRIVPTRLVIRESTSYLSSATAP